MITSRARYMITSKVPAHSFITSRLLYCSIIALLTSCLTAAGQEPLPNQQNHQLPPQPAQPADYIRLGYASYLRSFALINAGAPANNYGYWYPGKDNDGASGWAFEPQASGATWLLRSQNRGPWNYDGEIDLGFGAATRIAATIVTDDPIFGLVAFGGSLTTHQDGLIHAIPRDGLRRRFCYRGRNAQFDPAAHSLTCTIENRTGDVHDLTLTCTGFETRHVLLQKGLNKLKLVKN